MDRNRDDGEGAHRTVAPTPPQGRDGEARRGDQASHGGGKRNAERTGSTDLRLPRGRGRSGAEADPQAEDGELAGSKRDRFGRAPAEG